MKTLLCLVAAIFLATVAQGETPRASIDHLLKRIRAEMPKGWTATYDEKDSFVVVTRDKRVSGIHFVFNMPPDVQPSLRVVSFHLKVVPFASPDEYRRLVAANAETLQKAGAIYRELEGRGVRHKFDSFLPRNDEEKKKFAEDEALIAGLLDIPEFHYRQIGLKWTFLNSPHTYRIDPVPADEKVYAECVRVRDKLVALLTPYEKRP